MQRVSGTSKYSFTHRYVGYYGEDQRKLEGYVKNSKFVIVGSVLSVFEILHNIC